MVAMARQLHRDFQHSAIAMNQLQSLHEEIQKTAVEIRAINDQIRILNDKIALMDGAVPIVTVPNRRSPTCSRTRPFRPNCGVRSTSLRRFAA
jgi:hypothetical protein